MILKEVEMDLPYQKNEESIREIQKEKNIEYAQAARLDYELNWKEKRRAFQLMTKCMTSMAERIMSKMSKIVTKDCWKILIECGTTSAENKCVNLLGVYAVGVDLDVEDFFSMDDYEKKKTVVSKMREAVKKISSISNMDLSNLLAACDEVSMHKYINEWFWKKPMKLKQKYVQIKVLHEVKQVSIYMVFLDCYGEIKEEKLLVNVSPHEIVYDQYLGKLEWVSENSAMLTTKTGEKFIEECNW